MDAESLWILKKLAAQEISARSADRMLRALELLQKTEESEPIGRSTDDETMVSADPQRTENLESESSVWSESGNERPLLDDDGIGIINNIIDGTQLILEKIGDVTIQGWDQGHIRAEGPVGLSTVLEIGKNLKIWSENGAIFYIPSAVKEINIANGSGSIDIRKYPNDVVIDSDTGEISISEASGSIKITSFEGNVILENCRGVASLESSSGSITARRTPEGTITTTAVNIEAGSGDVILEDIIGDVDVNTRTGNITLERCKGKNIDVESSGGHIVVRDMTESMNLRSRNGSIMVDGFSSAISTEPGIAEIHIESDGGNVKVKDCYANVHVDSGSGNVFVSGANPSFDGMGSVELRMKTGDAYFRRGAFENIHIAIEEGNAEVSMEKLNLGGSGQISVYKGDVTVEVLPSFGCELIVLGSRENMHIELPVEITERDKNKLRGILNGGGPRMEIIAPNGEIRLHALKSPHIHSNIVNAAGDL